MKLITSLFVGAMLALGGGASFAAAGYMMDGTWAMNADKSKFGGPAFKSQTRTYTTSADGLITMTFNGMAADGATVSGGATFKYDGKDYPISGSTDYDTLWGKKVNATTAKFELKKGAKIVGKGTRTWSDKGKTFTLVTAVKGAKGKPYTTKMVFEKQ